jgi:hypothetical protein
MSFDDVPTMIRNVPGSTIHFIGKPAAGLSSPNSTSAPA